MYFEPFIGGGSVIIELLKHGLNKKYRCYDINPMIVQMFKMIKENPNELIDTMRSYADKNTKNDYYRIREEFNLNPSVCKFMYLNKTCFRGQYRVSRKNKFNVPFGHYKKPIILDEVNIMSLHELFNQFDITFEVSDYRGLIIPENSVVYFDPPFYGVIEEYTAIRFCHKEYIQILHRLRQNPSIKLIHSNSASFRDIYTTDEHIEEITLYNRANSKNPGSIRTELLYYPKT
jgi:DNA adenine methylase